MWGSELSWQKGFSGSRLTPMFLRESGLSKPKWAHICSTLIKDRNQDIFNYSICTVPTQHCTQKVLGTMMKEAGTQVCDCISFNTIIVVFILFYFIFYHESKSSNVSLGTRSSHRSHLEFGQLCVLKWNIRSVPFSTQFLPTFVLCVNGDIHTFNCA